MAARTRATQRTTDTSAHAPATAPLRLAVVDPDPTVRDADPTAGTPETSATTASRAALPRVTLPNRRLADGYFGESYLVWSCLDCGETGPLTALPTYCPDCSAGRESLAYRVED
ncbi:DUF7130 family rubredoxin-like protein [Halogeometricum luteum]|uniref:DUF7130 domain-containing protein n=1 Tax=Halogeometricum luteum TaxID=2950537 RepID=A0ABU2G0Q9_9EURY|nr:hypothetical protein [Halogeometricum sp. S3BR5-2]MDS0294371.1 hypothetical protein [Halogeometricum sp. S3BR5-2]